MIEAQGLTKRYGDKVAVDNLSFTVHPGVVTGFLGPNGAGKSTTMRLILGLDRPDAGQALINGHRFRTATAPMSEMDITAQHLIVIGRGKLLADTSTADFIAENSEARTRVRSPQGDQLAEALASHGVQVTRVDGFLEVPGMSTDQVGDVAAAQGLTVHELFTQRSSLEEAFMEMTRDSVEYHAASPAGSGDPSEERP